MSNWNLEKVLGPGDVLNAMGGNGGRKAGFFFFFFSTQDVDAISPPTLGAVLWALELPKTSIAAAGKSRPKGDTPVLSPRKHAGHYHVISGAGKTQPHEIRANLRGMGRGCTR